MYDVERQPKPPASLGVAEADAIATESGLAYKNLKPGTGTRKPAINSNVTAFFNGWSKDGDLMMSTSFGAQQTFIVKDIPIDGLREGFQLMVEGETKRFWIPSNLAFGDKPEGKGLPGGVLTFDVRLLSIN